MTQLHATMPAATNDTLEAAPNRVLSARLANTGARSFSGGIAVGSSLVGIAPLPNTNALPPAPKGDALQIQDIIQQVAGVYPRIMLEGDMDAGAWSCGMVAGLIHDIPTCKELIDRIMREADHIIGDRLEGMRAANRPSTRS